MISPATVIRFESSILSLSLFPDSRGFCHFNLQERDDRGKLQRISSTRPLTCEYLTDLLLVATSAMHWIDENCEDITADDGRHLYYKFKEPNEQQPAI